MEGVDNILMMKSIFGDKIMPGGRITKENVEELNELLGLRWYHGRRIV
jgi:copper homeostasis protein CutC